MKILITGFDPFGGESVNPAYELSSCKPSASRWERPAWICTKSRAALHLR